MRSMLVFLVLPTKSGGNARILSLLKTFGLQDCFLQNTSQYNNNYFHSNMDINEDNYNKYKIQSLRFLKDNLNK